MNLTLKYEHSMLDKNFWNPFLTALHLSAPKLLNCYKFFKAIVASERTSFSLSQPHFSLFLSPRFAQLKRTCTRSEIQRPFGCLTRISKLFKCYDPSKMPTNSAPIFYTQTDLRKRFKTFSEERERIECVASSSMLDVKIKAAKRGNKLQIAMDLCVANVLIYIN